MNYGELKTLVLDTAHREDLTAEVVSFVRQAEEMIARDVRASEMITRTTIDETNRDDGAIYSLPADFLEARVLIGHSGSQSYRMTPVSWSELLEYRTQARPLVYTTYGKKMEVRGTPATATEFDLVYFARPAAFADDGDTNDLINAHHSLYLYASLAMLHLYTQDLEIYETNAMRYNDIVEEVNSLADRTRGGVGVAPSFNYGNYGTMGTY